MRSSINVAPERDTGAAPKLLTVPQVAETLGVSVRLVWRLLAVGELDRVNCGRCARITLKSVEGFIERGGAR